MNYIYIKIILNIEIMILNLIFIIDIFIMNKI